MDISSLQSDHNEDENDEDDDDDDDEDNEDATNSVQEIDNQSQRGRIQRNTIGNDKQFILSYKDVEDSVRPFNGIDSYPIERWINDFEEAATMFGWNDLQKVVFAKKSLKGVAKLFVQSEDIIRTWKKLKETLAEDFSSKINSA